MPEHFAGISLNIDQIPATQITFSVSNCDLYFHREVGIGLVTRPWYADARLVQCWLCFGACPRYRSIKCKAGQDLVATPGASVHGGTPLTRGDLFHFWFDFGRMVTFCIQCKTEKIKKAEREHEREWIRVVGSHALYGTIKFDGVNNVFGATAASRLYEVRCKRSAERNNWPASGPVVC
ncbi:hypothetical protein AC579_1111 [Pseudocercospora musae]|uniref:Uncharacterized protein n=1 Tax=Pseudocercospora musae TaxID=113226 RepID=A0A139I051_9PEZI|nr:hypothetical protein AC579_1111 [Pseudocercospora musae]